MAAAADARGLKRICTGCGTRFYDFKKRPIICPQCQEQFSGEIKVKTRRGRVPAAVEEPVAKPANDDNTEVAETQSDTVSLEDIKENEDAADEDIELEGGIEEIEEMDDDDDIEEDLDVDVKKDE